jgi:hypothetical protein
VTHVPSFPTQLALSALIMGGVVGSLYLVGQRQRTGDAVQPRSAPQQPAAGRTSKEGTFGARSLLPARSWLAIDFDGRLTGSLPFSSSALGCADVAAPARVGVAVVGPTSGRAAPPGTPDAPSAGGGQPNDGVALVLGSPAVSAEFWRCVRAEVLAAGGRVLEDSDGQETLESPSGVVTHKAGRLVFSSDRSLEQEILALARGQGDSAETSEPHATLATGLAAPLGSVAIAGAPLLATLELPSDWLAGIGPEAQLSPLRYLTAGALRADADGGATGTLECLEPGCEELAAFLIRARGDLAAALPAPLGAATERSWTASREHTSDPQRGRLRLRWVPSDVTFSDWVGGVWRALLTEGPVAGPGSGEPSRLPSKPGH